MLTRCYQKKERNKEGKKERMKERKEEIKKEINKERKSEKKKTERKRERTFILMIHNTKHIDRKILVNLLLFTHSCSPIFLLRNEVFKTVPL